MKNLHLLSVLTLMSVLIADLHAEHVHEHEHVTRQSTLTDGFFGFNDSLSKSGIQAGFSMTSVYQRNVKGGQSTLRRTGEFTGSYDLELEADLERLFGANGILYLHGEGGWSDGIDEPAVGSVFGVNADAIGNRSLDIVELYYEGRPRPAYRQTGHDRRIRVPRLPGVV